MSFEKDITLYKIFQNSPIAFVQYVWRLEPQPIKDQYSQVVWNAINAGKWNEIKSYQFDLFKKGQHISWHQWLILLSVEQAINGLGKNKISIVSGHGTGKSSALSWLIIWYLFCFLDAQVGATAPTSQQMHDVLWKEIALWLGRMPKELKDLFEWSSGYLRVKERPETWFARARTAGKDNPEAMSGLHGDFVFIVADEASGIVDEIYKSAEGSLTGSNTLVILISNGTRNSGYFYDTHHDDSSNWVTMSFNSEDSPLVEEDYTLRIENLYGKESDEYKIRVKGEFPAMGQMDEKGWISLINSKEIAQVSDGIPFIGQTWLGVDPAGDGDDMAVWLIRDQFQARVIAKEQKSTPITIAHKTKLIMDEYRIKPEDVFIDNLGEGANVASELLKLDHTAWVNGVNWAEEPEDATVYLNKRAECVLRGKEWLKRGGAVVGDGLKREISAFMYTNNIRGLKQILDKPRIKKKLGNSPDMADAFFLTFYNKPLIQNQSIIKEYFDPYAPL